MLKHKRRNHKSTFADENLPQHIEGCKYSSEARKTRPGDAFELGLADRAALDQRDGKLNKGYFLRTEVSFSWDSADGWDRTAQTHRALRAAGEPYEPAWIYPTNVLSAYAYTTGYRALPSVRWACEQVKRPELAERYEVALRSVIRDADAVHRLISRKPTKEFLMDAGDNLIKPLLTDFRRDLANVVEELRYIPINKNTFDGWLPKTEVLLGIKPYG